MAIVLKAIPTIREFQLESDDTGEAFVTIRQATWAENSQRETIFAKQSIEYDDDARGTVRQTFNWTQGQLIAKEIYLTLAGARGIQLEEVDKKGEPTGEVKEVFTFVESGGKSRLSVSEDRFYEQLGRLPESLVREIHGYVREVNIQWKSSEGNAE
jgi:hypothetical protein